MSFRLLLAGSLALMVIGAPAPEPRAAGPTVTIQNGTVVGSSSFGVDSFKGIPYAMPPTGTRRLRPPTPLTTSFGTIVATGIPTACPQMIPAALNTTGLPQNVVDLIFTNPLLRKIPFMGEDCLTIDVQRPSNIKNGTKLPVVFWIYGGGFDYGATVVFDGTNIVQKSISLGAPVIYVAVNYRLAGFGFLPGKELQKDGSTNLGLRDQRLGLQWVADNIASFGGDPDRVTLWGQSAGSISVFDQALINRGSNLYRGKPLFIGAIMNSGSALPATNVTSPQSQAIYDTVVSTAGCSSASNTLECLRSLPFAQFYNAQNSVPSLLSLELKYIPRPDPTSSFFPISPADAGNDPSSVAIVPSIISDVEDEGAAFAIPLFGVQNTKALVDFLLSRFPLASRSQIEGLVNTYPEDPSAGCPYRTGPFNVLYPGFKRNAAMLGDIFILTRRIVLNIFKQNYPNVPAWSYLSSTGYGIPFVGSFHGLDIASTFYNVPFPQEGSILLTYFISFINYQDPNKISTSFPQTNWPQWQRANPKLLNLQQGVNQIIPDDFRTASYNYIQSIKNVLAF